MTAERAERLRDRFGLAARVMEPVGAGWDFDTYEVDGEWIVRFPRRPAVAARLRLEIDLVATLAPRLTVPVPRFELVSLDPLYVGYRKLPGTGLAAPARTGLAADVGRFLSELHDVPVDEVPLSAHDWHGDLEDVLGDFRRDVVPLLSEGERGRAENMFATFLEDSASFDFQPAVVHADLGPEHLLTTGGRLTGVIDWSDARIGDPAIDFAWLLHGAGEAFATELAAAYAQSIDEELRRRAHFFHRIGPWYEVEYGLSLSDESFVRSGLEGIRARLES